MTKLLNIIEAATANVNRMKFVEMFAPALSMKGVPFIEKGSDDVVVDFDWDEAVVSEVMV